MPIDVYDKNEKHLGIIQKTSPWDTSVYIIAITDLTTKDIKIDIEWIKKSVAGMYECKTLLGKVKEIELEEKIEKLLKQDNYKKFSDMQYDDLIKVLFLLNYYGDLQKNIEIPIEQKHLKGYILYDLNKIEVQNGKIIINDVIDYVEEKAIDDNFPIFAKICDYPVIKTEVMGIGTGILLGADWADLGGRNHTHITKLKVKSGNYLDELELPFVVNTKKDTNIQLYLDKGKIKSAFCDGIIYELIVR